MEIENLLTFRKFLEVLFEFRFDSIFEDMLRAWVLDFKGS